jgi:hypothetical protein
VDVDKLFHWFAFVALAACVFGSFARRIAGYEERRMFRAWRKQRADRKLLTEQFRKAANGR